MNNDEDWCSEPDSDGQEEPILRSQSEMATQTIARQYLRTGNPLLDSLGIQVENCSSWPPEYLAERFFCGGGCCYDESGRNYIDDSFYPPVMPQLAGRSYQQPRVQRRHYAPAEMRKKCPPGLKEKLQKENEREREMDRIRGKKTTTAGVLILTTAQDTRNSHDVKTVETELLAAESLVQSGSFRQALVTYKHAMALDEEKLERLGCSKQQLMCAIVMCAISNPSSLISEVAEAGTIINEIPSEAVRTYLQAKHLETQFRFHEAATVLQDAIFASEEAFNIKWPTTRSTMLTVSKDSLQELLERCRNPPLPDAKCVFSECDNRAIYLANTLGCTDNWYRVLCSDRCRLEYHAHCWRKMKKLTQFTTEKDLMSSRCFTPDCCGSISEVRLFDHLGNMKKDWSQNEPAEHKKKSKKASKNINHAPANDAKSKSTRNHTVSEFSGKAASELSQPPNDDRLEDIVGESEAPVRSAPAYCNPSSSRNRQVSFSEQPPELPSTELMIRLEHQDIEEPELMTKKKKKKSRNRTKSVTGPTKIDLSSFAGDPWEVPIRSVINSAAMDAQPCSSSAPHLSASSSWGSSQFSEAARASPDIVLDRVNFFEEQTMAHSFIFSLFRDLLQKEGPVNPEENPRFLNMVSTVQDNPELNQILQDFPDVVDFLTHSDDFVSRLDGMICLRSQTSSQYHSNESSQGLQSSLEQVPVDTERAISTSKADQPKLTLRNIIDDLPTATPEVATKHPKKEAIRKKMNVIDAFNASRDVNNNQQLLVTRIGMPEPASSGSSPIKGDSPREIAPPGSSPPDVRPKTTRTAAVIPPQSEAIPVPEPATHSEQTHPRSSINSSHMKNEKMQPKLQPSHTEVPRNNFRTEDTTRTRRLTKTPVEADKPQFPVQNNSLGLIQRFNQMKIAEDERRSFQAPKAGNIEGTVGKRLPPKLLEGKICSICQESLMIQPVMTLDCCHSFHDYCIKPWAKRNNSGCPNCNDFVKRYGDCPLPS